MKKLYECKICSALYNNKAGALACEALGFNPLYGVGDKVLYEGAVVVITQRHLAREIILLSIDSL